MLTKENRTTSNSIIGFQQIPTEPSHKIKKDKPWFWTPILLNVVIGTIYFTVLIPFSRGLVITPKTGFFCKDPSISYKHRPDSIGNNEVIMVTFCLPIMSLCFLEPLRSLNFSKNRLWHLWLVYADFFVCGQICFIFLTIIKLTVGYPRPDFLDFCQPDLAVNCTAGEYVENFKCQKAWHPYYEWLSVSSFFSGHATLSVYGSLFSMYLIETRFSVEQYGSVLKMILQCLALVWGTFASLSRYVDRRHHWWDVIIGMVIGIAQSFYTIYVINKKFELNTKEIKTKENQQEFYCS